MQAVVLAAGFGTRMKGDLSWLPKALLPLRPGCVLDHVISSIWVPGVTAINVVHCDRIVEHESVPAPGQNFGRRQVEHWPKLFKNWKRSVRWTPDIGSRREPPYIKLHNDGARDEETRRGSVGDLAWVIRHRMDRSKIEDGILVVCCDNLFVSPHLGRLAPVTGRDMSAITCRHEGDLHRTVLAGNPRRVPVTEVFLGDPGDSRLIGHSVSSLGNADVSSWRFCGPAFLSAGDIPFLLDYADYHERAELKADDLGAFFTSLAEDKPVSVTAVVEHEPYADCGTPEGYEHAKTFGVMLSSMRGEGAVV